MMRDVVGNVVVFFTDGSYREYDTSREFFDECVECGLSQLKTRVQGIITDCDSSYRRNSLGEVFKYFLYTFIVENFYIPEGQYSEKDAELQKGLLEVFLRDDESLALKTVVRESFLCLLRKSLTEENLEAYQKVKQYLGLMR